VPLSPSLGKRIREGERVGLMDEMRGSLKERERGMGGVGEFVKSASTPIFLASSFSA
jgi:hypothetical protein